MRTLGPVAARRLILSGDLLSAHEAREIGLADEVFPAASYQYVLYGMGFRPDALSLSDVKLREAQACFNEATVQARRFVTGLPGHRSLIDHIHKTAT